MTSGAFAEPVPGVLRLGTRIINWYLVADDEGVTLVDTGAPAYRSQLEPGLAQLGRKLADVRAVILTHGRLSPTVTCSTCRAGHASSTLPAIRPGASRFSSSVREPCLSGRRCPPGLERRRVELEARPELTTSSREAAG